MPAWLAKLLVSHVFSLVLTRGGRSSRCQASHIDGACAARRQSDRCPDDPAAGRVRPTCGHVHARQGATAPDVGRRRGGDRPPLPGRDTLRRHSPDQSDYGRSRPDWWRTMGEALHLHPGARRLLATAGASREVPLDEVIVNLMAETTWAALARPTRTVAGTNPRDQRSTHRPGQEPSGLLPRPLDRRELPGGLGGAGTRGSGEPSS